MTSIITLTCPHGIIVATDMRETQFYDNWLRMNPIVTDGKKKIYRVKHKTNIAIACWGLAEISTRPNTSVGILQFLHDFDRTHIIGTDTVDSVAQKLKTQLEGLPQQIIRSMGCHVVGYVGEGNNRKPKLRHVFHAKWHNPGEFTNEDSHYEYHTQFGDKTCRRIRKDYPVLFNGDSVVANLLFNYAKQVQPYYDIIPDRLSLDDCENLALMIIGASTQRLDYFFDLRKFTKMQSTVGGGISLARITVNSFQWKDRRP